MTDPRVAVVVATRNRRDSLLRTLARLGDLPERPRLVVVDNGSRDGTPAAVREAHPNVLVLEPGRNLGGAARTLGSRHVAAPYVAFADDDSWWAPGSLAGAADVLDRHSGLALVAARVLVGEEQREDPVCVAMAASPLGRPAEGPGRAVLGFVACGAVVRRDAFLAAGGFHPRFGVGGEERLLAVDLACAGWRLAYVPEVVAVHDPSPIRDADRRRRVQSRNGLWTDWLRRPFASAAASSLATVRRALVDPAARGALLDACAGISWVLAARSVVPPDIERALRLLDAK